MFIPVSESDRFRPDRQTDGHVRSFGYRDPRQTYRRGLYSAPSVAANATSSNKSSPFIAWRQLGSLSLRGGASAMTPFRVAAASVVCE